MQETKFAVSVHLMTALAYNSGKLMSSEELSKSLCTNPSFVRKLVVSLSNAGLVHSHRGKSGGVQLSKLPAEISLSDIYSAISERNIIELPQKEPYLGCPVSKSMGFIMEAVSNRMETSIVNSLSQINLSEILKQIN
ncbi:MAG: Rrf2 family transcriptional regulator [Leptospira sp.]|nr:Rrf2 family transcriptional regulator [Leptospira sp.]